MRQTVRLAFSAMLLVAVLTIGGLPLQATAVIQITDGTCTVTLQDNGSSTSAGSCVGFASLADASGVTGQLVLTAVFNTYSLTVSTGVSKPVTGSAVSPSMDINVSATRLAAGVANTLTVKFSDTDFTRPVIGNLTLTAGGTAVGGGSYAAYYDTGNAQLATSTLIDSKSFVLGAFAVNGSGPGPGGTGSYSLTQVITEDFPSSTVALTFSGDFALGNVPEPASVALLGGVLLATMSAIRRKVRRA